MARGNDSTWIGDVDTAGFSFLTGLSDDGIIPLLLELGPLFTLFLIPKIASWTLNKRC